jgi:REP element-mobilizing transposase RayT
MKIKTELQNPSCVVWRNIPPKQRATTRVAPTGLLYVMLIKKHTRNMKTNIQARTARASIRLKNYDYSQEGFYFVTICVQDKKCLFGEIVDGVMVLNEAGRVIEGCWLELKYKFRNIDLDYFVIMPNHFHAILSVVECGFVNADILDRQRATTRVAPTLGLVVGAFKSISTNEYIRGVKLQKFQQFNKNLWQRNYFERVIRDENELNLTREYITNNPLKWELDEFFVE